VFLYTLAGCSGYGTYGDQIKSDLLINYPETTLTSICRIAISFVVAFSYPLQVSLTLSLRFKI